MDASRLTAIGDERFAQGRLDEAMSAYRQALSLSPGFGAARAGLDAILERARTPRPNEHLIALLLEGYADEGANWDALGWGAAHQLVVGWPKSATPAEMAGNGLLLEFLRKSLNRDATLERHLVALRAATARLLLQPEPSPAVVALAAAIAQQAWQNEYIWPDDPAVPDGIAGAMYRPQPQPQPDALEERRLAAELPELAPITDAVSQSVAAMYEANPYPRWTHLPRRPTLDVRASLQRDFPHARAVDFETPLAVLMPGAGTGQHPLLVASTYDNVEVTAVDLSRTSLAYGKRMAARHGVGNIEFLRGDILDLPRLGRVFDHVECVGVLHHMADPRAGLLAISAVMRPGAFLRLGLYGEGGRKIVEKARRDIAAARIPPTLEGLRDFRRRVMGGDLGRLAGLTAWEDFWSASLLRDLCFHVQEHRFTIPRLRAFLEGSGLTFLGFEFNAGSAHRAVAEADPIALYRARFRNETTLSDLARWEQLECEKPALFAGYAFVCQKD
ncbi:methyltransferase domain-containing protein [Enhydrobacter aerosaccus]|uniref:methyltransferase domain-containing protein n=1 Tax=Enhydrobacter aerosaccus TaxID=225324 RepID=UPI00148247C5|nr:methyltransferase domain-containing protein [Enhydrobacter aerosaccus]